MTKNYIFYPVKIIILPVALFMIFFITYGVALPKETATKSKKTGLQTIELKGSYTGSLAISSPASLGTIDLSIQLAPEGETYAGAISESATTHFGTAPKVNASITGTNNGITRTFRIQSEKFTETIGNQTVVRSFTITGEVLGDGYLLVGDYLEIIEGYTQEPISLSGSVLLSKASTEFDPVVGNPPTPSSPSIYLPLITKD